MHRLRKHTLLPALLAAVSVAGTYPALGAAQPRKDAPGAARVRAAGVAPAIGDNAALVYYSVWMNKSREQTTPFLEAYSDLEYGKALPRAVADYLKQHEGDIARLVRAGKMPHCDFGIDRDEGFGVLLPHLGQLRTAARMLNADAARCLLEGKPDEAADRFAAIFGLARHAATDRILISSLVSIAIASVPVDGLVDHNGAAMLTPAGRAKVLAAIERFDGAAGFRLKDAIEGEREMAVETTILKFDGPNAGRRFADEVLSMAAAPSPPGAAQPASGSTKDEPTDTEKVRMMDGAALQAEARKLNRFYEEVARAWDAPGAAERLKELSRQAERGEFGALGSSLLPAVTKCRVSQDKGVESLQRITAALRQADANAAAEQKNNAK